MQAYTSVRTRLVTGPMKPSAKVSIRPCKATFGHFLRVKPSAKRTAMHGIKAQHSNLRAIRTSASRLTVISQATGGSEAAGLEAELAALDATLIAVQGQVEAAEATSRAERQAQAAYEAEISDLTAEINARKREQQAVESAADAAEVKRMISRVEALKEEAASLTLILTERKDEISGLKRQLAEFEETAQPIRAYATVGLREREVGGGTTTTNAPSWDNDWGSINIPRPNRFSERRLPEVPTASAVIAPAAAEQPQASSQNVLRSGTAPGLLLAAGAMGIGSFWKKIKQAFPPEGGAWLDLSAISVVVGAWLYTAYQR